MCARMTTLSQRSLHSKRGRHPTDLYPCERPRSLQVIYKDVVAVATDVHLLIGEAQFDSGHGTGT